MFEDLSQVDVTTPNPPLWHALLSPCASCSVPVLSFFAKTASMQTSTVAEGASSKQTCAGPVQLSSQPSLHHHLPESLACKRWKDDDSVPSSRVRVCAEQSLLRPFARKYVTQTTECHQSRTDARKKKRRDRRHGKRLYVDIQINILFYSCINILHLCLKI